MPLSWIARGAASAECSRRLMQLRGVTPNGHPLWANWEVDPVLGLYPDYGSIFPRLTRRTKPATYSKAGRLGITKPRGKEWSDPNEVWRLRIYSTGTVEEVLAAFPSRTYGAIAHAARKRGFRRPPRPLKPSGIRIVDQILARARSTGWKLEELDAACRGKGYFRGRRWRSKPDPYMHRRAVEVLGGQVRASFQ
jgi:hypothetical protein